MDRRKFLIGTGSLAAGAAGAVGTGAFTSTRAERAVNVKVASDDDAFLSLDASVSEYAEETGKTVEFQFNDAAGASGSGLNANADTLFSDVLRVKNEGTDTARLRVGSPNLFSLPDGPMLVAYTDDEIDPPGAQQSPVQQATPFSNSPHPSYWTKTPEVKDQDLGVGQDLYMHFGFYLNSGTQVLTENLDGSSASQDPNDIPGTIAIYADSSGTSGGADFS